MPGGVTIDLTGWAEFQDKLAGLPDDLKTQIDGECEAAARNWESLAAQAAPVDKGTLRAGIRHQQLGTMNYEVTSAVNYSAPVEWGTGGSVFVPAELSDYAEGFRGRGIRITNHRPQPFFFIQMPIVKQGLIEGVQNILNTPH